MSATLYTIGHSNHAVEQFLALLRQHGIAQLVDVRSQPYSRWFPHFCQQPLCAVLEAAGVEYDFLGNVLGGRPEDRAYYDDAGRVDYARRAQAPDFLAGIGRLVTLAAMHSTVIMCAEEDPSRCHRRILVTPAVRERDVQVVHIRGDGGAWPERDDTASGGQLGLFG